MILGRKHQNQKSDYQMHAAAWAQKTLIHTASIQRTVITNALQRKTIELPVERLVEGVYHSL